MYIYGGIGWVHLLEGQGACSRVILVLRECIWNAPTVSLVLPAFDYTDSLAFPSRCVVYSLVSPWMTASRFLEGNKEAELNKTHHFLFIPTCPCFHVFPLLITPSDILSLSAASLGYSIIIIIIIIIIIYK